MTVRSGVSRAALVGAIQKHAPDAFEWLGGLDAEQGWPISIGTTKDVPSLLDRLFFYAFAVEQAKCSLRSEALLPDVYATGAPAEKAAVVGGSTGGQGFETSTAAREAVELHAMKLAIAHYSAVWTVEDVSASSPFDLLCKRRKKELRIEVKGTTGDGSAVLLTPNEVEHARTHHPNVALFVLPRHHRRP